MPLPTNATAQVPASAIPKTSVTAAAIQDAVSSLNTDSALIQQPPVANLPSSATVYNVEILQPFSTDYSNYSDFQCVKDFTVSGRINQGIDKIEIYLIDPAGVKKLIDTKLLKNLTKDALPSVSYTFSSDVKLSDLTDKINYRVLLLGYDSTGTVKATVQRTNFVIVKKPVVQPATPPPPPEPYFTIKYNPIPFYNGTSTEDHTLSLNNHYGTTSKYNYYSRRYETTSSTVDEKYLINFQTYVNYDLYTKLNITASNMFLTRSVDPYKTGSVAFDYIGDRIAQFSSLRDQRIYFQNILINRDVMKELKNAEKEKIEFPFYNQININYFDKSSFVNYLETYDLENEFLIYLYNIETNNIPDSFKYKDNNVVPTVNVSSSAGTSSMNYLVDPLIFSNMSSNGFYETTYKNFKFSGSSQTDNLTFPYLLLTTGDFYKKTEKKKKNNFFYNIMFSTFDVKTTPSFVLNNASDIVQTIAFKIEKYSDAAKTKSLSNVFFLNSTEIENFEYIDSQIKYDTDYFYNIYEYKMNCILKNGNLKRFITKHLISDKVILRAVDAYPIAPTYNIVLDKNENKQATDRFLFLCDTLIGSKREFLVNLNGPPSTSFIDFRNDDYSNIIQVFRTDKKPLSFTDFKDSLLLQVSGTSFVDDVIPNKDYYYMLRSIDVHGHISNPSYVTRARIVTVDSFKYVESEIYADYEAADDILKFKPWVLYDKKELENKKDKQILSFKRYLQISPSTTQLLLKNLDPASIVSNTIDNDLDLDIFGADNAATTTNLPIKSIKQKNYKLRIKSKNSGRIVDINFSFKLDKK